MSTGGKIRYLDNAPEEPVGLPILFSPGFTDFADESLEVLRFFSPDEYWLSRFAVEEKVTRL